MKKTKLYRDLFYPNSLSFQSKLSYRDGPPIFPIQAQAQDTRPKPIPFNNSLLFPLLLIFPTAVLHHVHKRRREHVVKVLQRLQTVNDFCHRRPPLRVTVQAFMGQGSGLTCAVNRVWTLEPWVHDPAEAFWVL